ncbi:HAD family hydrolase [Candidatus Halobonum tyrrellensis]|uniref:Putative hydrolase of the HAD superfamily protein n=1 Tax=Candidatus Halobonum tyrrellensis G22 TaxID=1324957 RepID=V4HE81_9EURY|nr:HAD family hydrolase [Candidatus Halobonum tyrrellensis]ESP88358.1 putative hydrolase of the HAD superfamily protein [Candidatus Halobonum tyrrellensis G22]
MLNAVGFDLDYTLAVPNRSRRDILADAVREVASPALLEAGVTREAYLDAHARHRTAETREPVFADLLGGIDPVVAGDAGAETEADPADPAALATAYREAVVDALVPVEGVVGLLAALRETYRVGLLTNGPVRAQESKLDALGWWDEFHTVHVSGSLPAGKPDGRAFRALLDGLGTDPEETAFVGDHPAEDMAGAADAGLVPIQVLGEGDEPAPDAVATVERDRLARDLPGVLASL